MTDGESARLGDHGARERGEEGGGGARRAVRGGGGAWAAGGAG